MLRHERRGSGPCVADANRLAQLLGNLVSNAMTYGRPDAPVTVTSTVEAASFSVAVHNLGVSIPVEAQARLFQPMTRGANAAQVGRSVGLGLFIVSEIAKAHRGTTHVRSSPQEGSTFTATFPRG